jgi:hypothetical protein
MTNLRGEFPSVKSERPLYVHISRPSLGQGEGI